MPGLEVAAAALGLANSALESILKISDRVAAQLGVEGDLAFIRDEFAMMQAFLKAADKAKRAADKRGKVMDTWVRQVRTLAYDVEDCLEDASLSLERRRQSSCRRLPRAVEARRRIVGDIKKLRARVEDVSNRSLRYRLIDHVVAPAGQSQQPPAELPHDLGSGGGENQQLPDTWRPEVRLADLVVSGDDERAALRVISVWRRDGDHEGVSVSVVKEAYDDPRTQARFPWRAWVRVAAGHPPFDPDAFVKSLLRQLYAGSIHHKSPGAVVGVEAMRKMERMTMASEGSSSSIHDEFQRLVKEKRYLFVLDDLADAEEWLWIKTYLPDCRNGSRVVVRTKHQGIAMLCPEQPIAKQWAESEFNDELPDGQPRTCLMFTKGLEQSGTNPTEMNQGVRSNSKGAGESSGSTVQTEEGQPNRESMSAALEESWLVGRDSEASEIIEQVLAAKSQEYVCVLGSGGVGKTALVKNICQNQRLRVMFEMVAWVTMQDPFTHHEFTRTVKQKLAPKKKKTKAFSTLPSQVNNKRTDEKGASSDKRSKGNLIVLDNVSSKKDWDRIKLALLEAQINFSRVIVTTREPSVAKLCERSYNLLPLRDGNALELFKKKVKVTLHDYKLSDVANEIVGKCGGLPQVIINVAASLQERSSFKEWKKTRDHLTAELQNNPKLKGTNKILTHGYKNLSSSLKSCFLYLSVFPQDSIIRRRCLVRRWIAEGYSREKHGMSAEEVADKQFQDLISRNMIQPSGTTTSKIGNSWETYVFEFQNLMHKVSRRKSAKENLVLVLDEDEHSSSQAKSRARHVTVLEGWSREKKKSNALESIVDLSHIRSLTVIGECKSFFISKKMRLLRVLDLEDTNGLRDHDLSPIGKLRHLRYLSLRGVRGIFHLPDSVGNLSNLETLDVRGTTVTKLPSTIAKLLKLKYLRAGIIAPDEVDSYTLMPKFIRFHCLMVCKDIIHGERGQLEYFISLLCLMVTIWLKGLDPYGVKVPKGVEELRSLHTLGVVNVARGKNVLRAIGQLTQLRKLGITGISTSNFKKLESSISNLRYLKSLSMRATGNDGLDGCLDGISPPQDLESLKLYGSLGKLPRWFLNSSDDSMGPSIGGLAKLTLRSTLLQQDDVRILGKLPNLTSLRLQEKSFEGEELHFAGNTFASLVLLEIRGLSKTRTVKFEESAMAKLNLLQIDCCWDADGCSNFRLTGVSLLLSLKEVQLNGLDCGGSEEDPQESGIEVELPKEAKERPAEYRERLAKYRDRLAKNRVFKNDLLTQLEGHPNKPELKTEY